VLIASVPGVFSAGNGLADFRNAAQSSGDLNRPPLCFLLPLVRCGKPLVAAVSGVVVGIGTAMLRLRGCRHRRALIDHPVE
jgi:enoyl-CoA hydratase/carnithine racemase